MSDDENSAADDGVDSPTAEGSSVDHERSLSDTISRARLEYGSRRFDLEDLAPTWHEQFAVWLAAAISAGVPEAYAMVLCTADSHGAPSARTVLLRGIDERGLCFYTNRDSMKGRELAVNPSAAIVFPWIAIHRQVAIRGTVSIVSDADSDAYWATRPRDSRVSALASPQSQVVESREALEQRRDALDADPDADLSRPAHWGGYRLTPTVVEFWQGRNHRFHDRLRYRLHEGGWVRERLAP